MFFTGKGWTSISAYAIGMFVAAVGIFGGPDAVQEIGGEEAVGEVVNQGQVFVGLLVTLIGSVLSVFSNDTKK